MAKKRYNRRRPRKRPSTRRRKSRKQVGGKFNATLKRLKKLKPFQRRSALSMANDKFIRHFSQQIKKLKRVTGLRPSLRTRIKQHAKELRKFTNDKTSMIGKRKMLTQRGGFVPLIFSLIPAIASVAGSVAGGLISRR